VVQLLATSYLKVLFFGDPSQLQWIITIYGRRQQPFSDLKLKKSFMTTACGGGSRQEPEVINNGNGFIPVVTNNNGSNATRSGS